MMNFLIDYNQTLKNIFKISGMIFFFYLKTLFRTRNLPKQMSDEELSQLSPNIYYYYYYYYYYYLQQSNYNFLFRREKICENYRKHNHEEII